MTDLKITNAAIPDFEKGIVVNADIEIENGVISFVGHSERDAKETLDAAGKVVSPGFIDIHMHEETLRPDAPDPYYISYRALRMGVTTNVGGNCGNNRVPVGLFRDYAKANGAPTNYMLFAGHNFYRDLLGIDHYRAATKDEIAKMKDMLAEDKKHGIVGLSYGIEYSPGIEWEELIGVGESIKNSGYLLSAHFRSDTIKGLEPIHEMIDISKSLELPMQISHIGSGSAYGHMKDALNVIQQAVDAGTGCLADCYPYDAFAATIGSAAYDESYFERWDKTYSAVMLTGEPYVGVFCDQELFRKARKEYPQMIAVGFIMNEDEIIEALKAPFMIAASDSLYRGDKGHPRGAGTFPRILGKYVRDEGKLDFMDMLYKMTRKPALRLGLKNKGEVKPGFDADLVIFDRDTIIDKADFQNPTLPPEGIEAVLVNGQVAVKNNEIVNGRLGTFIDYKPE